MIVNDDDIFARRYHWYRPRVDMMARHGVFMEASRCLFTRSPHVQSLGKEREQAWSVILVEDNGDWLVQAMLDVRVLMLIISAQIGATHCVRM